jgi:hypothetical protein
MRDHGVNMPYPKFDDQGRALMIQSGGPLDATKQQGADRACRHLIAGAVQNGPEKRDPAEEAKMRKQQLTFAKCMRAHGIDMPDPKFSDNGGFSISIKGGDANNPRFQSTQATCAKQAGLPKMGAPGGSVQFGTGSGPQTGSSK